MCGQLNLVCFDKVSSASETLRSEEMRRKQHLGLTERKTHLKQECEVQIPVNGSFLKTLSCDFTQKKPDSKTGVGTFLAERAINAPYF